MPRRDHLGRAGYTTGELSDMLYVNPSLELGRFEITDPELYNNSNTVLRADFPVLVPFRNLDTLSLVEFDKFNQHNWKMPEEYQNLDIAAWVLGECKADEELQRAAEELFLFQDRDAFQLLQYLKYMVDTLRRKKILWGVGRGSSVASFVLYLIGVHRINPIKYQLSITEFLK